eukprot:scaffold14470_cov98-Cylindrotheca_fusiformis.AAC.1
MDDNRLDKNCDISTYGTSSSRTVWQAGKSPFCIARLVRCWGIFLASLSKDEECSDDLET